MMMMMMKNQIQHHGGGDTCDLKHPCVCTIAQLLNTTLVMKKAPYTLFPFSNVFGKLASDHF